MATAVQTICLLLRKGDPIVRHRPAARDGPTHHTGGVRIRCPKCAWEPRAHDRWACTCLHLWNTFDTRGRCPACQYQWLETQCLRCQAMSLHEDWYVDEPRPPS